MSERLEIARLPAAVELGRAYVDGAPGARLMVILRAPGCVYARRDPAGGCTNCGFGELTTCGEPVAPPELSLQLERALDRHQAQLGQVRELDLFCSGSLLCDEEIPAEARVALLAEAGRRLPGLRRLLVESRPEYATASALSVARRSLARTGDDVLLEVGVGLESADEAIREQRINKGFSLEAFERAAGRIAAADCGLVVYLLLKPLGTSEREAIDDVIASGYYLADLAKRLALALRVCLEPVFVPAGTPLHDELRAGRYQPPSLWSVIEATRGLAEIGHQVHVGQSDEGLPVDQAPAGCSECDAALRAAIARFNETQSVACFAGLCCACRSLS